MAREEGTKDIVGSYINSTLAQALHGEQTDTVDVGLAIGRFVEGLLVIDTEKPMTREDALAKLALISALLDIKIDTSLFDK